MTLTGSVETAVEKAKALQVAENVQGVKSVVDNLSAKSYRHAAAPSAGVVGGGAPSRVEFWTVRSVVAVALSIGLHHGLLCRRQSE